MEDSPPTARRDRAPERPAATQCLLYEWDGYGSPHAVEVVGGGTARAARRHPRGLWTNEYDEGSTDVIAQWIRQSRRRALLLGVALSLAAAGCVGVDIGGDGIRGSGVLTRQEFALADFDELEVSNTFKVDVRRSDAFGVSVTVDDNFLEHLVVEQRGGTLRIGLESGISTRGDVTIEARVTMPELRRISLSGASRAELAAFSSDERIDIRVLGASSVTGELTAGIAQIDVSGASSADLTGTAREASLNVSGASRLDLAGFTVERATVELSGASRADLTVTGTIEAVNASGASRLVYRGSPAIGRVSTSGASTVESR